MSAHLMLAGGWEECAQPSECELIFHVEADAAEMQVLPRELLLPLLEVAQPPDDVQKDGGLVWLDADGRSHRDYDLPAIVYPAEGISVWSQHGQFHRGGDRPAVIWGDQSIEWWRHGKRHRNGGLPAVILLWTDDEKVEHEFWVDGERVQP